jgi:hypothetical protein
MKQIEDKKPAVLPEGVSTEFLLEFLRHVVRNIDGGQVTLAAHHAATKVGASKEATRLLLMACKQEQQRSSMWPAGFMPEIDIPD